MLTLDVTHRQGEFTLAANLQIGSGLTALFGPSGSGKTTLITLVAGLTRPTQGTIRFADEIWSDTASGRFVPPHRRRIGYVFQEGRLFPHMSVRQNLGYGQRHLSANEPRESLQRITELLAIAHLLDRRPLHLSGGEKQRVALGRALMASPRLLLMDEPLSALDSNLKAQILPDIERIRDEVGIPILYVSHAVEEVSRLATRVVAFEQGRAIAIGAPDEVLSRVPHGSGTMPAGNFISASVKAHHLKDGLTEAESRAGQLFLRHVDVPEGTPIRVFVPISEIVIATGKVAGLSTLNRLSGQISAIEEGRDASVEVAVNCEGEVLRAEVTKRSAESLGLSLGQPVHLLFKTVSLAQDGLFRQA